MPPGAIDAGSAAVTTDAGGLLADIVRDRRAALRRAGRAEPADHRRRAGRQGGLATEIDLVFVTDQTLYGTIAGMKARDYFARREQIVREFPKGLRIRTFELEAAQRQIAYKTEPPCGIVGTLLFVNYDNDQPNRIRLEKAKGGTLVFGPDDFTWSPER